MLLLYLVNQTSSATTGGRCRVSNILRKTSNHFIDRAHKSSKMLSTDHSAKDESLANVFSDENKAKALKFIQNKQTGLKFQMTPFLKRAAVLIPLCYDVNGKPAILYTLRSLKLNSHRGEISFPGGTSDEADNGEAATTALRETEEELGISKDQIEILGELSPLPTASSLMGVTPVLGFIKVDRLDPETLAINPDEVHVAFTITLEHLCNPVNWGHTQYRRGFGMPIYKNMNVFHSTEDPNHKLMVELSSSSGGSSDSDDNKSSANSSTSLAKQRDGQREIKLWGLTAILTHLVLEAFLPTLYKREVPFLQSPQKPSSQQTHHHGEHKHHHHTKNPPGGKL